MKEVDEIFADAGNEKRLTLEKGKIKFIFKILL